MKDLTKMMVFMFLGLIFAILVLGFHKSGSPSGIATSSTSAKVTTSTEFGTGGIA